MTEGEAAGVKRDAAVGERAPGSVLEIAQKRHAEGGAGDPELVRTAGAGFELQQGPPRPGLQTSPPGGGLDPQLGDSWHLKQRG